MLGKSSTPVVSPKTKSELVGVHRGCEQVATQPMIDSEWIDYRT